MTKIGPISLDTWKNVCVTAFEYLTCITFICYFEYVIHGNQHSQHSKNYKNQELGNKMEGDTEDSTAEGLKDREIDLIRRKVWRCSKEEID